MRIPGIDGYEHSWVSDLILKYVAGVRVAGHKFDYRWNSGLKGKESTGSKVYLEGGLAHESAKKIKIICIWATINGFLYLFP